MSLTSAKWEKWKERSSKDRDLNWEAGGTKRREVFDLGRYHGIEL